MRQMYETQADREKNAQLADDFGRALGFALDVAPKACLFDYWVLTPIGQYGIAEMRIRSCEKEKHDTLFFSATKWKYLTQTAGKKLQSGWDFVNGARIAIGESLT